MLKVIQLFLLLACLPYPFANAFTNPSLLEKFRTIYTPIYKSSGLNLELVYLENNIEEVLQANRLDPDTHLELLTGKDVARVEVSKGFFDLPYITEDMATLGLCHEVGHHLAGKVRYEPNADYYATFKCTRIMFRGDDNETIVEQLQPRLTVQKICTKAWRERTDQLICMRTLVAAEKMVIEHVLPAARAYAYTGPDPTLDSQDKTKVEFTQAGHPRPQCRLDTYVAGAICNRNADDLTSFDHIEQNFCDSKFGDKQGFLPRCWYSPKN